MRRIDIEDEKINITMTNTPSAFHPLGLAVQDRLEQIEQNKIDLSSGNPPPPSYHGSSGGVEMKQNFFLPNDFVLLSEWLCCINQI